MPDINPAIIKTGLTIAEIEPPHPSEAFIEAHFYD